MKNADDCPTCRQPWWRAFANHETIALRTLEEKRLRQRALSYESAGHRCLVSDLEPAEEA